MVDKKSEKEVPQVQVTLDTVAKEGFVSFNAPRNASIDDVVQQGAEAAQKQRIKGGAAFGRMVSEGYQVKNVATGGVVKPETQIRAHAADGKVHYKVNAAGENGFYDNTPAIEETYNF
jgi:hypothetical protein